MEMNEDWPDIYDEIYTSNSTWTLSHNSVAAVEAPGLKISCNRTSLKWLWNHPNQHNNSHKLCSEKRHPFWVWRKVMKNATTTWSEFPTGGRKGNIKEMLGSQETNKYKIVTIRDSSSKVNKLSTVVWDKKLYQSSLGLPIAPEYADWGNLNIDEIASKTVHKDEEH